MDMHSGGGLKEPPYQHIYIEAPEDEAKVIFYNRFGHNPERVTCTCCGYDYSISYNETLEQLTGYDRNCRWIKSEKENDSFYIEDDQDIPEEYELDKYGVYGEYITLEGYMELDDVLIVYANDISDGERTGDIPQQGYIWVD